jgi:hypothetical protein
MTTLDPWQELIKGLELAEEIEKQRPPLVKEYRLYYNDDGSIVGLWETGHPEGKYIVLQDPDIFHRTNTNLLKVVNGELRVIDPTVIQKNRLIKSTQGQPVVRGHASIALTSIEEYQEIEYYDRTDN